MRVGTDTEKFWVSREPVAVWIGLLWVERHPWLGGWTSGDLGEFAAKVEGKKKNTYKRLQSYIKKVFQCALIIGGCLFFLRASTKTEVSNRRWRGLVRPLKVRNIPHSTYAAHKNTLMFRATMSHCQAYSQEYYSWKGFNLPLEVPHISDRER